MKNKANFKLLSLSIIVILLFTIFSADGCARQVEMESYSFTESSRKLSNPNRGFYQLYSFMITDKKTDYPKVISELYSQDTETKLTLVQICLQSYRQKPITEKGLSNIEALFDTLGTLDKQLIIRFTYDREGLNEQYEPEALEIISGHMEQLEYILRKYSKNIFSLQGLFIGNWGEMNGTQYDSDSDLQKLAQKLAGVTDSSTYLAVRVPAQWRSIMQCKTLFPEDAADHSLNGRLGLFNDGMLGNESDYGTYSPDNVKDTAAFPRLGREEELEFQDRLCRRVPNGGEVIDDNSYNDLDNAIKDLALMHVTYLNKDYDRQVMEKWADTLITEEGCFYGTDGLTYIDRHLGYRLLITDTALSYHNKKDTLSAEVTLKNVGFAPLYRESKIRIILCDTKNGQTLVYPINQSLNTLSGGNEPEAVLTLSAEIPCGELGDNEYTIYFSIADSATGSHILLANEEDEERYGYCIGKVSLQ